MGNFGQVYPLALTPEPSARQRLTSRVKSLASEHGLTIASVTHAEPFPAVESFLRDHIRHGRLDGLDWFTLDRARVAADPRALHAGARSIVAVGVAYWGPCPERPADGVPRGRIARYAWGVDYHALLKRRMRSLVAAIGEEVGHPVEARCLVDTARIVDRAVAARAGLGWYGKNACIIVPGHGSGVLLGEILLDLDLEPDAPLDRNCGRCTFCLDRCPTGAIVAPYTIDTPRCLSFQTIEQRGAIPAAIRPLLGDWVFGCDVCQEVCPYTGAIRGEPDPAFQPASLENAFPPLPWLLTMTEAQFRDTYRGTPVLRAKRRGLARNAAVALGNVGTDSDVPPLIDALTDHEEPLVRGHAAWALGKLGGRRARAALDGARRTETDALVRDEIETTLAETERPS